MNERAQLEHAIATLEAQRCVLGDAVVDAALGPMREKLASLAAPTPVESQLKQVTILFADVLGFTMLSERLDAEDVTGFMNALWEKLDAVILELGGYIDKHLGDGVMALWGVEQAREDDPERAIRAALRMQEAAAAFDQTHGRDLQLRIGINTGAVLLGEVGATREFTAMGDPVNLAARLEKTASPGSILISHDTYRHVRGVFDVQAQAPLVVRGKTDPVLTYVVLRAKTRGFRVATRGVEGVETRMIGRDLELQQLQALYEATLQTGKAHTVTVVSDAGVGKSRLLYEVHQWLELRPEVVQLFKGRASEEMQHQPYALLRDFFAFRFGIHDSDRLAAARAKLEHAVSACGWDVPEAEATMRAHFIGQLCGIDFSASPHLRGILDDAWQIHNRAQRYLAAYFKALAAAGPVLLMVEDLHWADAGSLDVLDYLASELDEWPVLLVGATRPTLFEHRPRWGATLPQHTRVDLMPLTTPDSRALVDEILQKVDEVPDVLRELVVGRAEGNPFFVEELIKMLMEEGAIVAGAERWEIKPQRLVQAHLPLTLVHLLQARFDALSPTERATLQCAAVVGRVFWDDAIFCLSGGDPASRTHTKQALLSLLKREMIFGRSEATFEGTQEFMFKHALLRDAIYDRILKRDRREYHARLASWFIRASGDRVDEYLALIAEHFEKARVLEEAAFYYWRAGEKSLRVSAFAAARTLLERAYRCMEQGPASPVSEMQVLLHLRLGEVCYQLSDYAPARDYLVAARDAARHSFPCLASDACYWISRIDTVAGEYTLVQRSLEQGLDLARAANDKAALAQILGGLGDLYWRLDVLDQATAYAQESLTLAREAGNVQYELFALNLLAIIMRGQGNPQAAEQLLQPTLALAQRVGNREREVGALNNLGVIAYYRQDWAAAQHYFEQALTISKDIGQRQFAALSLSNLADVALHLGDLMAVSLAVREALHLSRRIGAIPTTLSSLTTMGRLLATKGDLAQGLALMGLARFHPAADIDSPEELASALKHLGLDSADPEVIAGLNRGKMLDLDAVVADLLVELEAASPD